MADLFETLESCVSGHVGGQVWSVIEWVDRGPIGAFKTRFLVICSDMAKN